MSVFATRLKIALENKNMRPSTLAYRIGVDRSTISNYLNGRYKAKSEMIEKMAQVLSVSSAWLDGFDVPMEREKSPSQNDELSENRKKLIQFAQSVPEDKVDLVIRIMKSILEET